MHDLEKLLGFVRFTNAFKNIERVIYVPGTERFENDAEHSHQLALIAWYLVTTEKLPLDLEKVLSYALVHDLVETYAGDMPLFGRTENMQAEKKEKEHAALTRIQEEFSEFPALSKTIDQYEERADEESVFVHALDKLLPAMNIYTEEGRSWRKRNITLVDELEIKMKSTAKSPIVHEYWNKLAELLVRNPDFFAPPTAKK